MQTFKRVASVITFMLVTAALTALVLWPGLPAVAERLPAVSGPFIATANVESAERQSLISGPVAFVQNVGQWPATARFQAWGGTHGALWLANDALWITMLEPVDDTVGREPDEAGTWPEPASADRQGVNIRLRFLDANPAATIEGGEQLSTKISYFIGADEAGWRAQVPVWNRVRYVDLYPGVDLDMGQAAGGWSWRLTNREAQPSQPVRLAVDGADAVTVEGNTLVLSALGQQVSLPLPEAAFGYQVVAGQVFEVAPSATDAAPVQQIEPDRAPNGLLFSTFLGGVFEDVGRASAVDYAGRVVLGGWTESYNFPVTPGAFDVTHNGLLDAYAARLSADGAALDYATFFGGSGIDGSQSVAVDHLGRVYVAGWAESAGFPITAGAFDRTFNGMSDAFVLRLREDGAALDYSTYLGGVEWDKSVAVAVDGSYRAYVGGYLYSTDFPTTAGAYDRTHNGNRDGFLTRMNADGSGLDYSTFLGGVASDWLWAVAVDGGGRAYVTGATTSANFPTTFGAYDPTFNGGTDAFVARFTNTGNALEYSTFLGGGGADHGYAIAFDSNSRAYVTGETISNNFPTTGNAFDRTFNGQVDAFVARVNAGGESLSYSTFLGGSDVDRGQGVAVDSAGRAHVVGNTLSADYPTSSDAFDRNINGSMDAFVTRISNSGDSLSYSTFIGGGSDDWAFGVHVFDANTMAVVGDTISGNFPVTFGAFDPYFNGFTDAFALKLASVDTPTPTFTWTSTPTWTPTPTSTRTWTPTPTPTWTPTPTATRTWTPTPTPTRMTSRAQYLPMLVRAVAPTPTPTRTPVPGDPYEPNNSFDQAWGALASSQTYRALIYALSDEEDFYWFDMSSAHAIQVELWNIPTGNDYHLYLYNSSRAQVGYSGNSGNQPESIATPLLPAGRYYVRVQRVTGYSATEQYALKVMFR